MLQKTLELQLGKRPISRYERDAFQSEEVYTMREKLLSFPVLDLLRRNSYFLLRTAAFGYQKIYELLPLQNVNSLSLIGY